MSLAQEDIEFIKQHLGEWLTEVSLGKPPAVYEIELRERMVRVEEALKHQGELIQQLIQQMDKRFEQVDLRFEMIERRFEQVDKRFEEFQRQMTGDLSRSTNVLSKWINALSSYSAGWIASCSGPWALPSLLVELLSLSSSSRTPPLLLRTIPPTFSQA